MYTVLSNLRMHLVFEDALYFYTMNSHYKAFSFTVTFVTSQLYSLGLSKFQSLGEIF